MNHVSAFAGIGAADIAAEQLGYETTFAIEIDPYCQKILAKRFPLATILGDMREVDGSDLGHIDLMSGGSPCQGLSTAGKGLGLEDHRSSMWFEYLRIIGEARPSIVLLENVAVLRSRGLDVVVNGLAEIDYLCWWDCVPALAVGAPHLRDRIWLTAVPYEAMPELEGKPFKKITDRFPRAGAATMTGLIEMEPQAAIKMCKEAMGAVKRADGVTWLTKIDQPLWPTPSSSSSSYGSNQGGAAGRVGPVRHSLSSMAKSGDWPRLWPSSSSRDWKDTGEGRMGRGQLPEAVRAESRVWPTPSTATATQGPGRSTERKGGPNLRTAVAEQHGGGPLNPDWVEWLLGLQIGWTDIDCPESVQRDWLSEHGIPRVARDVPNRKQRLMAIGNSLVWKVAYTRIDQAHRLLGIELPVEDQIMLAV